MEGERRQPLSTAFLLTCIMINRFCKEFLMLELFFYEKKQQYIDKEREKK